MNAKAERLLWAARDLEPGSFVVEIGTIRFSGEVPSDGWSTYYLAKAAQEHEWNFVSVDNDKRNLEICRTILAREDLLSNTSLVHSDGLKFLQEGFEVIDFLYLDGGSDPEDTLAQFEAAGSLLVAVDDVQAHQVSLGGETVFLPEGKGSALLPHLRQLDWDLNVYDTEPGFKMAVARRRKS